MLRKTYKIKFKKKYESLGGGEYLVTTTDGLIRTIIKFCADNKINLKKIKIKDWYKNSFVKIKGTKDEYQKLYYYLVHPEVGEHIKVISAFKN